MKSDAAPELTISDVIMSKAVKPAEEITSFKFAIDVYTDITRKRLLAFVIYIYIVCCVGSVQI